MNAYQTCTVCNYAAVRWNGVSKCLEAQDNGGSWYRIDMCIAVAVPPDLYDITNYVRELRNREMKTNELRAKYPSLDKALGHAELIRALCEAEENKSTVHPVQR